MPSILPVCRRGARFLCPVHRQNKALPLIIIGTFGAIACNELTCRPRNVSPIELVVQFVNPTRLTLTCRPVLPSWVALNLRWISDNRTELELASVIAISFISLLFKISSIPLINRVDILLVSTNS